MGRLTAALPWIGLGAVASIALANWFYLWIVLLAPVLLVGGFWSGNLTLRPATS
jgi:hypothetical protein